MQLRPLPARDQSPSLPYPLWPCAPRAQPVSPAPSPSQVGWLVTSANLGDSRAIIDTGVEAHHLTGARFWGGAGPVMRPLAPTNQLLCQPGQLLGWLLGSSRAAHRCSRMHCCSQLPARSVSSATSHPPAHLAPACTELLTSLRALPLQLTTAWQRPRAQARPPSLPPPSPQTDLCNCTCSPRSGPPCGDAQGRAAASGGHGQHHRAHRLFGLGCACKPDPTLQGLPGQCVLTVLLAWL